MKTRQQKKQASAQIKDKLAKAKIAVFTTFARAGEPGLPVAAMRALKKDLRAVDAEYMVGKKTLLDKALKESRKNADIFAFAGSLGVAFGYGDETGAAKAVYNFAKKNPALRYFGAWCGANYLDKQGFGEFAKLPGREALIGRLLGLMRSPLTNLANVLGQVAKIKN